MTLRGAKNICSSSNAANCTQCLALGPECGWCTQEDFIVDITENYRCDTFINLKLKGCRSESIEHPSVQLQVLNTKVVNSQVTPAEVSVHLRPGASKNFLLRVHRLEKYPVDFYYLVDVSASMQDSIEKLNSIGFDLSQKMANFSQNIRFGFGTFVDKPVTPYISIQPQRIKNQCRGYRDCMPPHGYIHVLPLTENITEFKNIVVKQKLSGNIDNPEGTFDAMLQAAVCHKDIGWRKEAKRLLIVMTDQTSHLTYDSKLAGIVIPNDGRCHLKDNVYSRSTDMEHPTLGQLGEKLIDHHINGVFAVQGRQFHWYKDLSPLLPGTVAKKMESSAANLKELVVDAYELLLSEVKIQVENPMKGVRVDVTAICPDGSRHLGMEGCKGVKSNENVFFNVTITMDKCDVAEGNGYIFLKPIGFNETAKIKIHRSCTCQCSNVSRGKGKCVTEVLPDCQSHSCKEESCSLDESVYPSEGCKALPGRPACSGRGVCICGKCFCHKTKLGKIYGKYCEMDDFSCPYHYGKLCSGNGECEDGKCKCFSGWEGDRCHCTSSKEHCMDSSGLICSGRGSCICGQCKCTDEKSFGPLCKYCSNCDNTCTENWNCEHSQVSSNISESQSNLFKDLCDKVVYYIDQTSECFSDPRITQIFFIILTATFLLGFLTILIIRKIILQCSNTKHNRSSDYQKTTPKKDKRILKNVYTRTVTYTREKPEDLTIDLSSFGVHETFKYKL
ncbi:integrin beta-8 [Bombina bombina]|uniref:integrin beta-8 n=1 Tax=Bombina bombina TaxID=8345 RepID=UPI00235ABCDE|nr:integrin beta-8 [Bombina bombina]